jgi:hypothetical protein
MMAELMRAGGVVLYLDEKIFQPEQDTDTLVERVVVCSHETIFSGIRLAAHRLRRIMRLIA